MYVILRPFAIRMKLFIQSLTLGIPSITRFTFQKTSRQGYIGITLTFTYFTNAAVQGGASGALIVGK